MLECLFRFLPVREGMRDSQSVSAHPRHRERHLRRKTSTQDDGSFGCRGEDACAEVRERA